MTSVHAEQEFDELFRQYAPFLSHLGLRILGRDDEVSDLVQDVFLVLHRRGHQLTHQAAMRSWLATTAIRMATARLRRRRLGHVFSVDEPAAYQELAAADASPEHRAVLQELYQVLDSLPVKHRVAWTLRYVLGESAQRVSELCECSLATAKRRIEAAQKVITKRMGK